VSKTSSRRKRPGKNQRDAARQSSVSTAPSQLPSAIQFAGGSNFNPQPQPGKFPIVFPAGAGEPTRDSFFELNGLAVDQSISGLPGEFINSSRFAEFSANAGITDEEFESEMIIASLLGLAQNVVHAHTNLGLPLGDFSAISSTDIYLPSSAYQVIKQFGEFSVESLGTRFIFLDYESEVKALVRAAKMVSLNKTHDVHDIIQSMWWPVKKKDQRTSYILAVKLQGYFQRFGVTLELDGLLASLFSGTMPDGFTAIKHVLPNTHKELFDPLFKRYTTESEFRALMVPPADDLSIQTELQLGGLDLDGANLRWSLVPKVVFPELAGPWLRKKPTYTKFFSSLCGSQVKAEATGSPVQLSSVSRTEGITIVRSHVAVSAPEFSLLACAPATGHFPVTTALNVVMTTSLAVKERLTEFVQRDWI
jgi:hypothetical protein